MPYGIAKTAGGDTPANDQKMQRCVQQVMQQGHSKLAAILICKASIDRTRRRP